MAHAYGLVAYSSKVAFKCEHVPGCKGVCALLTGRLAAVTVLCRGATDEAAG
jgi:hypothetical protein